MEIVWTLDGGELAAVQVDAAVRESHVSSAHATDLAVERGANVTDHVRPQPFQLTVEGIVTNAPIDQPSTQMDGATGAMTQVSIDVPRAEELRANRNEVAGGRAGLGREAGPGTIAANVWMWSSQFDRVRTVNEVITNLMSTGTLVKIVTGLREYEDMVIENFEVVRSAQVGEALAFTLSAKQVRIVDSETVSLPEPREPRGRPGQNRGRQDGESVTADDNASLWYNTSGAVSQWATGSRGVFQ